MRPFGRRFAMMLGGALILLGAASVAEGTYMNAKAGAAQIMLDHAWSQTLAGKTDVKPWGWADTWPVAKITVPRLGASNIVLSGFSGEALAFAPGLLEQGAFPGEPGMAVIAAHRDTHFEFLKDIQIGDVVNVAGADGRTVQFKITETQIVNAAASGLVTGGQTPRIALVTCFPFNAITQGDQRFVAIGELVVEKED